MAHSRYGPWTQVQILRARSEIPQATLASFTGISVQHLSNLERGHRWPTDDVTRRLATALHVPLVMIARTKVAAA